MLKLSSGKPPAPVFQPLGQPVRAVYVSSFAALSGRMDKLIELVNETELNALVIDVNSGARLTGLSRPAGSQSYPMAQTRSVSSMSRLVKKLKENHIYLIARIVTFKDAALADSNPRWAIRSKEGKVWKDRGGNAWIDPFREEAWAYPIALAEQASSMGFDEVQFDYVRFPENGSKVDREVQYANKHGWSKSEAISRFLRAATDKVHAKGAKISADVFGLVTSTADMGIGQRWGAISSEVDVISPMIYPSHYSNGMWGIRHPDLTPGLVVSRALADATRENAKLLSAGKHAARVRPWLQGFTAGWVRPHQTYGKDQIQEQIRAARKAGYSSYMLWNSASRYPIFHT
ncbi:putative glycoside hydrolase [Cohnella faecalis]|uniref:putative glycoside hydrolase n=1 Tax=Cohnella faecalis TaxID=2315694 RepID=UPI00360A0F0E